MASIIFPSKPIPWNKVDSRVEISGVYNMKTNANIAQVFPDMLPFDGALALASVIEKLNLRPRKVAYEVKGMFGPIMVPFKHIPVAFRNGDKFDVPWGEYDLEEGNIRCAQSEDENMPCFQMTGFNFTDQELWEKIIGMMKREKVGLYKGRALRMKFDPYYGNVDAPEELTLSKQGTLIFNPDVEEALETSLFIPIENAQACREMGIPLKRGICLEGPYGMGKSLTANVTAYKAINNGFTFLFVPNPSMVDQAFKFAKRLAPAVVFVEDFDEFLKNGREDINTLLNTLDGVDSKDNEIITIFSTNYVDIIDRAMLRPGRVDALISLDPPNKQTVNRLIKHYGGIDAPEASAMLEGASPALIRETIERAKLLTIKRKVALNDGLLCECAPLLKRQRELMQPVPQKDQSLDAKLARMMQTTAYRGGFMGVERG